MPPEDADTQVENPTVIQQGFTAEQVEKFRADERNKYENKIAKLQQQFDEQAGKFSKLAEATAAREAAEAEALLQQQKQAKTEQEADLDAKTLLDVRTQEWEKKFAELEAQNQQREAQHALERQFLELKTYTQGRIADEKNNIHPAFYDYIDGTTTDQIEASIKLAIEKTEAMAAEIAEREKDSAQQQLATGGGVTTRTGPTSHGSFSEIQGDEVDYTNLSYADFVKLRPQLMKQAGGQGLFS